MGEREYGVGKKSRLVETSAFEPESSCLAVSGFGDLQGSSTDIHRIAKDGFRDPARQPDLGRITRCHGTGRGRSSDFPLSGRRRAREG